MTDTSTHDPVTAYLAAVRQREQAAIPGPWSVETELCDCSENGCAHESFPYALRLTEPWKLPLANGSEAETSEYNYNYTEIAQLPPATAQFIAQARMDVRRLLAMADAVLALHVQATTWGDALENGRFDYCSTCSGHPAWPCPEVQAISAALLGEEFRA